MNIKYKLSLGLLSTLPIIVGGAVSCGTTNKEKLIDQNNNKSDAKPVSMHQLKINLSLSLNKAKEAAKNNPVISIQKNQFTPSKILVFDKTKDTYKNPFYVFVQDIINQGISDLNSSNSKLNIESITYKELTSILDKLLTEIKNEEGITIKQVFSRGQAQMLDNISLFSKLFKDPLFAMNLLSPVIGKYFNLASLMNDTFEFNFSYNKKQIFSIGIAEQQIKKESLDNIYHIKGNSDPTSLFIEDMKEIGPLINDGVTLVKSIISGKGGLSPNKNAFAISEKMLNSFSTKLNMKKELITSICSILKELYDMNVTN
ncbi:hypothetical protein [Mycoplasma todarodis]|uniref:Lipoprotein n=1 Tax=Mycoplasma todarodis TaxID=1937191 RepID=A0A4R0XJE3_9MOLU|nr:hypothetical protein [Mycoplasma todarodis]TCG10544.1 hypothetical protein C4B25_03780 [Mycoplasma todarodis]